MVTYRAIDGEGDDLGSDNRPVVKVDDDGPGIPEDELNLVWERFYKVSKARTLGGGGVGLGLAIAKEIIQASGGKVSLESMEGKGFGFSLPIVKGI